MSDLNLLPKKHTNFSIERILLKQTASSTADGGGTPKPMAHSPQPHLGHMIEQKVDLTVETCLKIVQSATDRRTAAGSTSACTVTSKNVIPLATGNAGTSNVVPTTQTLLLAGPHRPLNRVLDNPWCSRGPLMFDPKLISGSGPAVSFGGTTTTPHKPASLSRGAVGDATPGLLPVTPPSPASAASSSLVKAEVERKVVLSAYANNSVIERNRLSINYPYPVGLFNAYASAAAVAAAAAAATVSSVHHYQHHNQQQQQQQQRMTPSAPIAPSDALLAASAASPSIGISMQQQHNQTHPRTTGLSAAALLAGSGPAPLHAASAALFSSFYQLQKSDENQNSIFDQASAEEEGASDGGTTVTSGDGGKDTKTDLLHAHHLHHHHHHLHHHHEPGSAGTAAGGTLCTLMFPDCSYQCAICDKIFGTQDTLMSHEKSHKTPRFECEECGKGFSQLRNYKYHVSVHRGTKEFAAKCPECGKMFNDKGYLSSHLKIHRNKKEYSCPHCPKSFNQRVAFNMHCSVCGKSFADRSNMTLHHRLHSGIKPFACPICPKAFTKKHHLKTHLNYHTGYKPYKCPHPNCGQSFTQSSNMRTHAKKCQFKPPDSEFV
uniref:C2H2-type domain-containing protein n=1 Tax=Anopheles epiroticus TaxID=199890 RepID=A0A182P7Z3_9DIPT